MAGARRLVRTQRVFTRGLAAVYAIAFAIALLQNAALIGAAGLTPTCSSVTPLLFRSLWQAIADFAADPSLLRVIGCTDDTLAAIAGTGLVLAVPVAVTGRTSAVLWLGLYALYRSLLHVGGVWYGFGWETQLLETGFWVAFACPWVVPGDGPATWRVRVVAWYYRWLIAKVMLGAGLIKIRGDACWRRLDCLAYHYSTQPNPHPGAWYAHFMPMPVHWAGTLANHVVELALPALLLAPRRWRIGAGVAFVAFMASIAATGNLSFLNHLTALPAVWCFDDDTIEGVEAWWARVCCSCCRRRGSGSQPAAAAAVQPAASGCAALAPEEQLDGAPTAVAAPPKPASTIARGFDLVIAAVLACAMVAVNAPVVVNIFSPGQVMNRSFDAWHVANTYGAFGVVSRRRYEIVLLASTAPHPPAMVPHQGADDGGGSGLLDALWWSRSASSGGEHTAWQEVQFRCKPGAVSRRPCLITPWHLRLDWLMWFASYSQYSQYPWLIHAMHQLMHHAPPAAVATGETSVEPATTRTRLWAGFAAHSVRDLLSADPPIPPAAAITAMRAELFEYTLTPPVVGEAAQAVLEAAGRGRNDGAASWLEGMRRIEGGDALLGRLCAAVAGSLDAWLWGSDDDNVGRNHIASTSDDPAERSTIDRLVRLPSVTSGAGPSLALQLSVGAGAAKRTAAVEVGTWWTRRWVRGYVPPVERGNPSVAAFLAQHGWPP